jgi:hypothetical protein
VRNGDLHADLRAIRAPNAAISRKRRIKVPEAVKRNLFAIFLIEGGPAVAGDIGISLHVCDHQAHAQ